MIDRHQVTGYHHVDSTLTVEAQITFHKLCISFFSLNKISLYIIYMFRETKSPKKIFGRQVTRLSYWFLKSSPPSAAYMRHWTRSASVQIMACRLFGAEPLSGPMLEYCQLAHWEQISVKFYSKFKHFHSGKCIWKCRLCHRGHFATVSMC